MKIIDLGNGAECRIDDNGDKYWVLNGKWHRTDGAACEYANGNKHWWINGMFYTEEEFDMVKEMLWAV